MQERVIRGVATSHTPEGLKTEIVLASHHGNVNRQAEQSAPKEETMTAELVGRREITGLRSHRGKESQQVELKGLREEQTIKGGLDLLIRINEQKEGLLTKTALRNHRGSVNRLAKVKDQREEPTT